VTRLEDRILRDLRIQADHITPSSVPRLRLPGPDQHRTRTAWHPGSWRRLTWLVPLAAAAAVAAVIIGALTAVQAIHDPAPRHPVTGPDGLPPYYVYLPRDFRSTVVVARTGTGAVIRTLHAPSPLFFEDDEGGDCTQSISAAGDREFALQATSASFAIRIFLLRVGPAGGARLSAVHLPEKLGDNQELCYSLSPDGRQLALTFAPRPAHADVMTVQVITLATGHVRQWSYTDQGVGDPVRDLTWVTSRTLGYWLPLSGTYLLDTSAAGHQLVADSRRVTGAQDEFQGASPDGTRLLVAHNEDRGRHAVLNEISVRTGKVVRTFGECLFACDGGAEPVLWSDPSADRLIVGESLNLKASGPQVDTIGILKPDGRKAGGAFTRLRPQPRVEGLIPGLAW
jgi:hypothetical protein